MENSAAPKSGVFIADKPQGVTSHDVVAAFRAALHMKRVGHAGTLDPMATGVLIVGFGHATRLLNYISGHDKSYRATIRLGMATTTDDAEGEYREYDDARTDGEAARETSSPLTVSDLTLTRLDDLVQRHFTGEIEQVPSSYSAVKVHGVKAYDLARAGQPVELKARTVVISSFVLSNLRSSQLVLQDGSHRDVVDVDAEVSCSSGTYIRALARDLGAMLGAGGHLTSLRRTRIGAFDLADPRICQSARPLTCGEKTFTNRQGETVTKHRAMFPSTENLWDDAFDEVEAARLSMPCVEISEEQAQDCRYGRSIAVGVESTTAAIETLDDGSQRLCAILKSEKTGQSHPVTVFPLED